MHCSLCYHVIYYFRREENGYRKERFHRLLVPALFLMCFTGAIFSMSYFSPMSSKYYMFTQYINCLSHYHHNATNSTPDCLTWWGEINNSSNFPTSFVQKLVEMYRLPSPSQAWFCLYLFLYSQILAFNFCNWHFKQGNDGPEQPTCLSLIHI